MELVNATNEWVDMSPTFNMSWQIWVDGTLADQGHDEQAAYEDDWGGTWFSTASFQVSPYDCNVYLWAVISDNTSTAVDTLYANLSAPCEEVPMPEFRHFDLIDWYNMHWHSADPYSDGMDGSISASPYTD